LDASNHAHAFGHIALPPNQADQVGKVVFEITDLNGEKLGAFEAEREVFEPVGNFAAHGCIRHFGQQEPWASAQRVG